MRRVICAAALVIGIALAGCSSSTSTADSVPPATEPGLTLPDAAPEPAKADADTLAAVQSALDGAPSGCDPLDTTRCLLPFPSNLFTVHDSDANTLRRVAFPADGMPKNSSGVGIDPAEWNRNDGFSPNTPILVHLPHLDAAASRLPSWTDIGSSLAPDATVVLIDADTQERVPLWAELDAHATRDADRLLTIRPAAALPEGHTFVVALRGMVDTSGKPIEPSPAFRVYRDSLATGIDAIEQRRTAMENDFAILADAGIEPHDLQLAWDFTVASERNISERMLHIRDIALGQLGDAAPAYRVTSLTLGPQRGVFLQIAGTFDVPNFLTGDGSPGHGFNYAAFTSTNPDELPTQNATNPIIQAPFVCNMPVADVISPEPAHLVIYGHGLLGDEFEINAGNVTDMGNEHNVVHCATKWAGLSEDDVPNAAKTLTEMSNFPTVADRLQQGVLNQIFLGRLMTRPGGLIDHPRFRRADGRPLIDITHLDYDGNSQGGIMGLMLAAVSPDIERAVLGVPGMNYSLLLPRSVDFDRYEAVMKPSYPNDLDRTLIFGFVQMLWDRGEGGGYAQHLTKNPYPGTEAKPVLLDVAYGDHQVSPLAAMVAARTIGATIHRPVAANGRWPETEAGWGLESTTYPSRGSAIIMWDSGMSPIPLENRPPRAGDDSHEDPRSDANVRDQKAKFLFLNRLDDACNGAPCKAGHHP